MKITKKTQLRTLKKYGFKEMKIGDSTIWRYLGAVLIGEDKVVHFNNEVGFEKIKELEQAGIIEC